LTPLHPLRSLVFGAALALIPSIALAQESALTPLRAGATDSAGQVRLARALRRAGHYDEALRLLQDNAGVASMREEVLWELARVRFDQGVFQPARSACERFPMPRNNPAASFRRRVCMARAYLLWNRVALAEREITAARAVNGNDGELQLAIGDARRLASDIQGAEAAYRAAETALPGRDEPALGLAQLYEMFQRNDDAQRAYAHAVEIDATDPAAALAMGRFLLRRRRDAVAALPLLRRAYDDRPRHAESGSLYGEALLATGAHDDALRVLTEAAQLAPTQAGVQSALGRTHLALRHYAEAEGPLRLAIRQVDTDASAYMGLAEVLERTGREPEAMTTWDAAIDRSPGDVTPRLKAASLAQRTHQGALARAYLDRVLTDDAQLAPALYLRGVVATDEGDRVGARNYLTQALQGHGEVDRAEIQRRITELDAPQRVRRR
jgi:tetratricopeptide (TPR) repeat protein